MEHAARLRVDQRVVRHRVELDRQLVVCQAEVLQHGADPLAGCAQRIAILSQCRHVLAVVPVEQLRPAQERLDVPCAVHLPGVRPHPGDEGLEALIATPQRLHAHGRQHLRQRREVDGLVRRESRHSGGHGRAVDDGEALLGV